MDTSAGDRKPSCTHETAGLGQRLGRLAAGGRQIGTHHRHLTGRVDRHSQRLPIQPVEIQRTAHGIGFQPAQRQPLGVRRQVDQRAGAQRIAHAGMIEHDQVISRGKLSDGMGLEVVQRVTLPAHPDTA